MESKDSDKNLQLIAEEINKEEPKSPKLLEPTDLLTQMEEGTNTTDDTNNKSNNTTFEDLSKYFNLKREKIGRAHV